MSGLKWVQERLNTHGYNCKIDGKWGPEMDQLIPRFQADKGLKVDSRVGPATIRELNKPPYVSHFRKEDFKCKCNKHCNGYYPKGMDPKLLQLLEVIRAEVNRKYPHPINGKERGVNITSGYRCPTHNKNVGGSKNSQHMYGKAADIYVKGVTPKQLGVICDNLNPQGGVGLGGKNIVHVDTRGHRSRWYYN